jgi:hemolysin activation/secretion protein
VSYLRPDAVQRRSRCRHLYAFLLLLPAAGWAQVSPQVSPAAAQPQPLAAPLPQPPPAPAELLSVPRMLDRPLGLEEGPRVVVKQFKLTGAVDHRRAGLTVAALQTQLEQARQAQPSDGYTVNQLQQVAAKLSDYYHSKGLLLAQVVVPAQEVHDGIVELRVLEGVLEAVKVEGNKHYRSSALKAPFQPLVGKAFEQDPTDAALLRLTEDPGLSVFGVITPGEAVGTSDLVLRVQRETPVEANIGVDNFGNKLSGEDRLDIALRWNSPLGLGDRFDIYGLRTQTAGDSAAHTTYGGVDYRIPFNADRSALGLSYSLNDYAVGQSLDITGKVKDGELVFHQEFFRSRNGVLFGELTGADKQADLTFPTGLPGQEHVIDVLATVGGRYSDDWRGFNEVTLSYLHGSLSRPGAGDQLPRAGADLSYNLLDYHLQRQQALTKYESLLFTVGGQWTRNALATLDQLALGGPASARAYEVAAYVADEGTYGSIEWLIGAPGFASHPAFSGKTWGDLLQLSLFVDAARGSTNVGSNGAAGLPAETMKDYGAALQFNLPNRVYARVSWAERISPAAYFQQLDPKKDHVYGSLGFNF